ncbi:hypothetical protein BGW39_011580 [Mortierella sp. 14UC]|nr:hypothetical protein BGW39_011580 [Mortierella sp. 14UC]
MSTQHTSNRQAHNVSISHNNTTSNTPTVHGAQDDSTPTLMSVFISLVSEMTIAGSGGSGAEREMEGAGESTQTSNISNTSTVFGAQDASSPTSISVLTTLVSEMNIGGSSGLRGGSGGIVEDTPFMARAKLLNASTDIVVSKINEAIALNRSLELRLLQLRRPLNEMQLLTKLFKTTFDNYWGLRNNISKEMRAAAEA